MNRIVPVCFLAAMPLVALMFAACSKSSSKLDEFRLLTGRLDSYTKQIEAKQAEIGDILDAYNQTVPPARRFELAFDNGADLNAREQASLETRIDAESDPSCRSILVHVSELNDGIARIEEKIQTVYKELPPPYRARGGETHRALCLRYLETEHHLSAAAADSALAGVPLLHRLIEGFDVWCVYDNGRFSTYVARGSACMTPACCAQRAKDAAFEPPAASQDADTLTEEISPAHGLIGAAATPVSLK